MAIDNIDTYRQQSETSDDGARVCSYRAREKRIDRARDNINKNRKKWSLPWFFAIEYYRTSP